MLPTTTQSSDPENLVFYGSKSKTCNLTLMPNSEYFLFSLDNITNYRSNETIDLALRFKSSLFYLSNENKNIYLPCPPTNALLIKDYANSFFHNNRIKKSPFSSGYAQEQIQLLGILSDFPQHIMLKTENNYGSGTTYTGYMSGKRSAIIYWDSDKRYYRLKGCGNLNEGFPLEALASKNKEAQEIRGCQFLHTALREQYMTNYIKNILDKEGILIGNIPVGIWKYEHFPEGNEFKIKDAGKLIDKYCGIFETKGEKRLATHLLQGLELILAYMVQEGLENSDIVEQIVKELPNDRIHRNQETNKLEGLDPSDWEAQFIDIPVGVLLSELAKKPLYSEEANKRLYDLFSRVKENKVKNPFNDAKIFEALPKLVDIPPKSQEFKTAFTNISASFTNNKINLIDLLSRLYARVGWEVGKIKRILQDNNINWGYYADHEPNSFHCNSHPNNFIVLSSGLSKNIVAPLDFDIAFLKENFISVTEDSKAYGTLDQSEFDQFLNSERYALETALGGSENMANFKYNTSQLIDLQNDQKMVYSTLKIALRDTIMLYFRLGYDKVKNECMETFNAQQETDLNNLIQLALILTDDILC